MMNDMCKLVLDPIYEPRIVPEPDRENDFELLYREQWVCTSENKKKPVNRRRPFALELCYPFPELKPIIGLPYVKQKDANNSQLYGRARGQKMVNLNGLDRKMLNQKAINFTNQQADNIITSENANIVNSEQKVTQRNSEGDTVGQSKPQLLQQPFMSKRNGQNGSQAKQLDSSSVNHQIKKPSLLNYDPENAFGSKKISHPDTSTGNSQTTKPLLKELSKPRIGGVSQKKTLQKVQLPVQSQSKTITQRNDELSQMKNHNYKFNSKNISQNPYYNSQNNGEQVNRSGSKNNMRSKSLASTTQFTKKPQLAKSTFNIKDSKKFIGSMQNNSQEGSMSAVMSSDRENQQKLKLGQQPYASDDKRAADTVSMAELKHGERQIASKQEYRSTGPSGDNSQVNSANQSQGAKTTNATNNNYSQQPPKSSKPILAPWRGGGKTSVFQSGGKYMGGVGGGYSGGSNHGALTSSQSSNQQLPHIVRNKYHSRVTIKQP